METTELRLGNYVLFNNKVVRVVWNDFEDNASGLEAIPLTEEWLLKFGFEILLNDREIVLYRLNSADVSVHAKGGFTFGIRGVPLYKITYIHELQNSYYEFKKQILTCTHDQ